MSGDKKKLDTQSATALANLPQGPYTNSVYTMSGMALRWDQYLALREQGFFIENFGVATAPVVEITPLGVAAQTFVG